MTLSSGEVLSIVVWVSQTMGTPSPNLDDLTIKPVSPHGMAQVACPVPSPGVIVLCPNLGYYNPKTNMLYLADWLSEEYTKSFMVHEIVHWFQDEALKVNGEQCGEALLALEEQAYGIQCRYNKTKLLVEWCLRPVPTRKC